MAFAAGDRLGRSRAPRVDPRQPFDDTPRGRVLAAMVDVSTHGGYRDATVARVLERAHVGWTEFTAMFEDLDGCMLATLDAGLECAAARAEAAAAGAPPDAAFSAALAAVLEAVAAQPALARFCVVDAVALGARASARREAGLQRFVRLLEHGLGENGDDGARPGAPRGLAAEMVVGGVHEVIQSKVRAGETRELPQIAGELERLWLPALRGA